MKKFHNHRFIKQLSALSVIVLMSQSLNASTPNEGKDRAAAIAKARAAKSAAYVAQYTPQFPQTSPTAGKRRTHYTKAYSIKGSSRALSKKLLENNRS